LLKRASADQQEPSLPSVVQDTPSVDDLEKALTSAKDSQRASDSAVNDAMANFDLSGSPESLAALQAARKTAADALEQVNRCDRLLARAIKARDEALARARHEALEQRKAELLGQLDGEASRRQAGIDAEFACLLGAARAYAARRRESDSMGELKAELRRVLASLGERDTVSCQAEVSLFDLESPIREAIRSIPEPFALERRYLNALFHFMTGEAGRYFA
jgi:hypothetical protein